MALYAGHLPKKLSNSSDVRYWPLADIPNWLVRAVLVPDKVRFRCPKCALLRHDPDAVHCKACGEVLNIPNDEIGI